MNEGLRGAQIEQKIIFVNSLFLSTPSVQPLFVLGHPRYSLVGASAAPRSVVSEWIQSFKIFVHAQKL